MKILGDSDVIEVDDILMFANDESKPEEISNIMLAKYYAGLAPAEYNNALRPLFVLRMSPEEKELLVDALAESEDGK